MDVNKSDGLPAVEARGARQPREPRFNIRKKSKDSPPASLEVYPPMAWHGERKEKRDEYTEIPLVFPAVSA